MHFDMVVVIVFLLVFFVVGVFFAASRRSLWNVIWITTAILAVTLWAGNWLAAVHGRHHRMELLVADVEAKFRERVVANPFTVDQFGSLDYHGRLDQIVRQRDSLLKAERYKMLGGWLAKTTGPRGDEKPRPEVAALYLDCRLLPAIVCR